MVAGKIQLRLALSKSLGSTLEIGNNGFEQRIPVFYDNSGIEALALNNGDNKLHLPYGDSVQHIVALLGFFEIVASQSKCGVAIFGLKDF